MRYLALIFFIGLLAFSCIKKPAGSPIPSISFKSFKQTGGAGTDSAIFDLGYQDWDGDLFRSDGNEPPNIVFTTYVYRTDSNKFEFQKVFDYVITQPADGYYKGKSIQGDIYVPVGEFRANATTDKIVKFEIFMVDEKNNKSNVLTTPQFTLQ